MRVDAFDFELPPERIALRPAEPRESARLLVVRPGTTPELTDARVGDLPGFLVPGDVLVVNDTRVIPAALEGIRTRAGGGTVRVEATLVKRRDDARWTAFAKPARRLKAGDVIRFARAADPRHALDARVEARREAEVDLVFDLSGPALDAALAQVGHMPIPPYIATRRAEDARDRTDYQPLFARVDGSVAAPTASLHFTPALMAAMQARGIVVVTVTLHVGAGTFLPVKADDTADHQMHAEWGELSPEAAMTINAARACGGRIVTVGSTATRLVETAAEEDGTLRPFVGETDIFITPGYRFRTVDAMMTNFHLPRSTLVMLVAALVGHDVQKHAYAHAIAQGYRFYSYGDACLLLPQARA